ncbi:V-type proton ATPase subunit G 1-like, partial [Asparagus officinalis]|uniref:V-type proton ATPase subunit G 1-like n=1 Tax=Asparagus officinalis TaxID=4686 RepID=UPI00098E7242
FYEPKCHSNLLDLYVLYLVIDVLTNFYALPARMARLKQAKEEAEKEVAEFRAHMEAEFQKKLAASSGDSGANVKRLEQETASKILQLKEQSSSISRDVGN